MIPLNIGRGIAVARKRRSMTQEELGEAVGVHHTTISRYEAGTVVPSWSVLCSIATELKYTVGQLERFAKEGDK